MKFWKAFNAQNVNKSQTLVPRFTPLLTILRLRTNTPIQAEIINILIIFVGDQ
jgi:hypothetical protein